MDLEWIGNRFPSHKRLNIQSLEGERENPLISSIYIIWLMITFFKHSLEGFLRFGKSSQLSPCPFLVKILNGQIYDFFSGF